MTQASAQLNTRMDPALKRGGDVVFERNGLTSSEVVRAVWDYAVAHQAPPPFVIEYAREARGSSARDAGAGQSPRERAAEGRGLARAVAKERCGFEQAADAARSQEDRPNWGALRDAMYDDMLREMEERCR